jgi:hypothetical protein
MRSKGCSDGRCAYCSPACFNDQTVGRQVVTMLEDHVVGVDAETGAPLWQHPHRNKYAVHPNTPVLCGKDRILVSSGYGFGSEIIEIAGGEAKLVWSDKSWDNHFQGVAFYKGRIFSSGAGGSRVSTPRPAGLCTTSRARRKNVFLHHAGRYDHVRRKWCSVTLVQVRCRIPPKSFLLSQVAYGNGPHWSSPCGCETARCTCARGKGLARLRSGQVSE